MAKRSVAGTAADPTILFSDLTIDNVTYKLAYSFNAMVIAEQSGAGCNLLRGLKSYEDLTAQQLRALLFASMLVDKPDTQIEDVGKLIRIDTIGPITLALGQAYTMSVPAPDPKKEPVETQQSATA